MILSLPRSNSLFVYWLMNLLKCLSWSVSSYLSSLIGSLLPSSNLTIGNIRLAISSCSLINLFFVWFNFSMLYLVCSIQDCAVLYIDGMLLLFWLTSEKVCLNLDDVTSPVTFLFLTTTGVSCTYVETGVGSAVATGSNSLLYYLVINNFLCWRGLFNCGL